MEGRRRRLLIILGAAVVVIAAIVVAVVLLTGGGEEEVAPIPGTGDSDETREVTDKVWPATLILHVEFDPLTQANEPAEVAVVGGEMFLTDTLNNRLYVVSADGQDFRVLDKTVDPHLDLLNPLAITSHEGQLYVGDAEHGRVVVISPSGTLDRVFTLEKGDPLDAEQPRPIGIVVWDDGSFAVSDANNNRLNKYDADGNLLWSVGTGDRASGEYGLNSPVGLSLDNEGNVYVVDMLNSEVKKYSADGTYVSSIGGAGDTAGAFSRAKAVAVDDAGNVFVSDGLQAAVQVFDQAGTFLGFIGRKDPADPNSTSLFVAPHGVKILDGKLYVVDRFAGLFVFDLGTPPPAAGSETPSS